MRYLLVVLFAFLTSCNSTETSLTAQQIIDKAIAYSGADKAANSEIKFKFRDKEYLAKRNKGNFSLIRAFNNTKDVLTNSDFERFINSEKQILSTKDSLKFANAVNSVHYFSVLPYGLNNKAVHKKLLPSATVNGKNYYKVEITFSENGGGEDFEDVFIYWIGKKDFLVDYLAYSYHTNGGGKRLRVLKEQCVKNGIRFVDFHNYKPLNDAIPLIDIDKAFENNQLEKVSEIILKDIEVKILK
ncbi:DUF6503 family protein [Polaribacter sp.]|uniref:DUF6503 family protein n=1 Tax=Polaribacter sp. TaxID=1920175 RepID=UPI003EF9B2AD